MSFRSRHVEDPVWGSLRLAKNPDNGYYLETEIRIGRSEDPVTLSFTCSERAVSEEQRDLAKSIVGSIEEVLASAAGLCLLTCGTDLHAEYRME